MGTYATNELKPTTDLENSVRGYSKSTSLGKEEGGWRNGNKKWRNEEGVQPKKCCHSLKGFLGLFFLQLKFCSNISHETLTILEWVTIKQFHEAICMSDISLQLDPQTCITPILPTLLVSTCMPMCKCECAHRLELILDLSFLFWCNVICSYSHVYIKNFFMP